jgi:predicted exporter
MRQPRVAGTLIWALLALIAAVVAARATYTADLSAFLPRQASATQRLLVEQLREGPAAHLIIAAIGGADAPTRAQVSTALAGRLRADPAFASVNNGDAGELQRDRDFLFAHRYLLSEAITPQRFTVSGLHTAIGDSLDALASPAGLLLKDWFVRDPTGEMLAIIDSLGAEHAPHTAAGVWSSPDGKRALLVLQTRAPGSDTDGQQAACEALQRAFTDTRSVLGPARAATLVLRMSGPPVFAVASRSTIKSEVLRLSSISSLCIAALLLAVFRSLPALILTLVPVASAALAGVAAVALCFGSVHGITLGFGVTLIGEAVDYSIYLLIQRQGDFRRALWPTIRLGVATSVCGFGALLPSAFTGLSQLGLYSIAGLIAAAAVTRFVLPGWLPQRLAIRDLAATGAWLAVQLGRVRPARVALLVLTVGAAAVLYLHRGALWNRELAALSPIPAPALALDEQLRTDAGAPDVRYVVVASAPEREGALAAAHELSARLTRLVDSGVLRSFESPTQYLPPLTVQRARQASLPPPADLTARLKEALRDLPVDAGRLEPFVRDVEQARTGPLLSSADLEGSPLARAVDALLLHGSEGWSALLPLAAPGSGELSAQAVRQVRAALGADAARGELLDLKGEADQLYSGYLRQAVRLAGAGLGAIVILLLLALRSPGRVARIVAPLVLAVLCVAGLLVGFGQQLTIMHVVGMLLIVAVGSNYALFFDRASTQGAEHVPLTLASLLVANLATVTAFGVLACSSVPVLANLGETVAPGALLALVFSALIARPLGESAPGAST